MDTCTPPVLGADGGLRPFWGFALFHRALRRDVARFVAAVDALTVEDQDTLTTTARVQGLRRHWTDFHFWLVRHHEVEDENLVPLLRHRHKELGDLCDRIGDDHRALHPLLDRIDDLVGDLPDVTAADETARALRQLRDLLESHLCAEEQHLMPGIEEIFVMQGMPHGPPIPDIDSENGEQFAVVHRTSGQRPTVDEAGDDGDITDPQRNAFTYPWMADDLTPGEREQMMAALPPGIRARFPAWEDTYRRQLATWIGSGEGPGTASSRLT